MHKLLLNFPQIHLVNPVYFIQVYDKYKILLMLNSEVVDVNI